MAKRERPAVVATTRRTSDPVDVQQFVHAIAALPSDPPLVDSPVWYRTQKEHWLGWLGTYHETGAYGRRPDSRRDARFAYNHIGNPEMLLWLIEAAGLAGDVVRAAKAADRRAGSMPEAAAAIRRLAPWEVVQSALTFPARSAAGKIPKVAQEAVMRLRRRHPMR